MHRCINCESLQQQLDDLKQELANLRVDIGVSNNEYLVFKGKLGLAKQTATVAYLLYKANGRVLNRDYIAERMQVYHDDISLGHVRVVITKLRNKLKAKGFNSKLFNGVHAVGYSMTNEGIKFIDELLKD